MAACAAMTVVVKQSVFAAASEIEPQAAIDVVGYCACGRHRRLQRIYMHR
jgi:hypothetical protein